MGKDIAEALRTALISPNEADRNMEPANIVDGLFAIPRALEHVATATDRLGMSNAATPMGGLELVATVGDLRKYKKIYIFKPISFHPLDIRSRVRYSSCRQFNYSPFG